jgi:ADP-ribose pyrophosphatase YjhB (NUDIX family)
VLHGRSWPFDEAMEVVGDLNLPKPDRRQRMLPVTERYARFGVPDPKLFIHVPRGGVCLSAFIVVRNQSGSVLFGRPRPNAAWQERGCLPPWRVREIIKNDEWILPASHLMMGEAPEAAAKRISRIWLGLPRAKPRFIGVDSSRFPTGEARGSGPTRGRVYHWTLCFLYELKVERPPGPLPVWEEQRFVPKAQIRTLRIGRLHRDVLRAAG